MLRSFFRKTVPAPARPNPPSPAVQQWLVLQDGPNPSTDYYVSAYLRTTGLPVHYKNLDSIGGTQAQIALGTGVVIVRYLNVEWGRILRSQQKHLSRLVYFMDDELLDPSAWRDLPRNYVRKLRAYCQAHAADIRGMATDYWFSTEALLRRHADLPCPRVLPPQPLAQDRSVPACRGGTALAGAAAGDPQAPILVFYHGSAAHQAEIAWLRPIMAEVLARCPRMHFEIIGDQEVNKRFRGLPRTRVVYPMSWPNYLSHCHTLAGHIGLAPLLDTPFNAGRAHVKAFDIARCGAVGVYSALGPYGQVIRHGENGLLLENAPEKWVEALVELARDGQRLETMRREAMRVLA